jgi:hypothetical protein
MPLSSPLAPVASKFPWNRCGLFPREEAGWITKPQTPRLYIKRHNSSSVQSIAGPSPSANLLPRPAFSPEVRSWDSPIHGSGATVTEVEQPSDAAPSRCNLPSMESSNSSRSIRALTLLDLLREKLQLTGTKKGCDHGQCGACTVLANGRRINSCLSLAVIHEGDQITTVEGLERPSRMQSFMPRASACVICQSRRRN